MSKNPRFLYAPDPYFEFHPHHRAAGFKAEEILRKNLMPIVIFYSINMQAPYIFPLAPVDSFVKESLLNDIYPHKADLWKYEKKYILFEGHCKWLVMK